MAFTKVTGPGIHTLANITSHNINSSGIITATKFVGPLEASSGSTGTFDSLTVTGNVSVGGTLTYEDVTNIDSVGIVTAQNGLRVTAGGINVTAGISTFGGAIDANGALDVDGQTDLDVLNVAETATFSALVDVNNRLDVVGGATVDQLNVAGVTTISTGINLTAATSNLYATDGALSYYAANNGVYLNGAGASGWLRLQAAGSANDRTAINVIGHSATNGDEIYFKTNSTERLRIRDNGNVSIASSLSVTGISTFAGAIDANGTLDVDGATTLDGLTVSEEAAFNDNVFVNVRGKSFKTSDWNITNTTSGNALSISGGGSSSEKIRINSSGFVGIATDAPQTLLHLKSNDPTLRIQRYNQSAYGDITADTAGKMIFKSDPGGSASGDGFSFTIDNSEKFNVDSDGNGTFTGEVAAAQDYPDIRPRIDFNFLAVKKLDSRFTYQRTGPGSYVDEFGLVRLSAYNEPRFDHDPMTGECKGLLIEQNSTNQMIHSNDITSDVSQNSGYGVQNGTATGNVTTAPDGRLTADRYAANTTNGIHRVDLFFTSGQITNSTAYTFSVFVKANGYDKLHIRYGGYNSDNHGLGYDFSDGTTFAGKYDGTSALGAVTSSSMIEYPNGWYRCSFTFTTAADAASGAAGMFYYISNSEATTNFAGDGSSGMYFWGAQMETCDYATSLVVTDGETRTRGGELLMIEGEEFSDFYNQKEGTLVLSASYTEDIRGSAIVVIDDTSNESEYTEVGYRAGGGGSGSVASYTRTDAGNDQYYKNYASSATQGNEFKVAFAYKDNDYASSVNGQTVDTDTSGTTSKVFDRLRFSDVDTVGVVGSGHYRRFIYYPKRLSNNQVVTLTS